MPLSPTSGLLRRIRWILLPLALLLPVLPAPAAALGESPVTIDCGDGTPIHATVSPVALSEILGTVAAINEDASGPDCGARQEGQDGDHASRQWVIGAGVYGSSSQCPVHFSLKAVTDDERTSGFQRADFRNDSAPDCQALGPSHLRANVTCLAVSGNSAELKGIVSEATGIFTSIIGLHPGDVMVSNVVDTEAGLPDQIFQDRDPSQDSEHCAAPAPTTDSLDRGRIEVQS